MPRLKAGEFPGIHVKDVFLDGNLVEHVMEMDTDEGWVRCLLGLTDVHNDDREVTEVRHGHVTFTWRDDVRAQEVTVLHSRFGKYHLARRGWAPACGSRSDIVGFHYSKIGMVELPPGARARLCEKCANAIKVMTGQPEGRLSGQPK